MYEDVKEGLTAGVDGNGVLVGIQWRVLRKFKDADGNVIGEVRTTVPLTADELSTHLSAALVSQAADIAADRVVRDGIAAERDAARAEVQQLTASLANAQSQIEALNAQLAAQNEAPN